MPILTILQFSDPRSPANSSLDVVVSIIITDNAAVANTHVPVLDS